MLIGDCEYIVDIDRYSDYWGYYMDIDGHFISSRYDFYQPCRCGQTHAADQRIRILVNS